MKKFQQLFTFSIIIFAINLLLLNDWIILWRGAELSNVLESQSSKSFLLLWYSLWDYQTMSYPFFWRLPSAIFLILGLFGFYQTARWLFGQEVMQYSLMTLAASFFIIAYGKLASLDTLAFVTQILSWIFLIYYLKQPKLKWQVWFYAFAGFSILIQPLESLLWISLNSILLYFFLPFKKEWIKLNPLFMALIAALAFQFTVGLDWTGKAFYWSVFQAGHFKFWLYSIASWAIFIGFLAAGIRELIQKVQRKEELAIILACAFIAGLVGHAIALHIILALIVGRQIKNYFEPKYPYEAIVKTGAILHLVFAFAVATVFLIYSFVEFRGAGFRASLAFIMIYWMGAFIGVIGLYGKNKKYVHWGGIAGGLLATLIFLFQLTPVLESKRAEFLKSLELSRKRYSTEEHLIIDASEEIYQKLKIYGSKDFKSIQKYAGQSNISPTIKEAIIFQDSVGTDSILRAGWNDSFKTIELKVRSER